MNLPSDRCRWLLTSCMHHAQRVSHLTRNISELEVLSSVFLNFLSFQVVSMLLLLTLVYVFHGFQTHATPLASPLAESSTNATVILSTPALACICPADQRTIWDILWSCLATIFACSWVSVHPNIPAPNESSRRIFLRRLELMFWAVIAPEMIITWALRQWLGARHLEKLYKGELYQSLMY